MFATISTYLKAHEKLVLFAIAGIVLYVGIGKIDTLIQHHDQSSFAAAQHVAEAQATVNEALATQATAQAQQYQVLAEKVNAQNAQLVAANTQLAVALTKQQHTDAGLPPTELANRWLTLVPEAKPTVITGGIMVPESGAVATVQQLELVPVQQQQLVNAQKELTNEQSLLTASTGQLATLNEEVSGLKLEAVDQTKVCTAQVAEVKAAAAKSKRKWFVIGYVAGFLTRAALIR
jgi:hypothetical protein